MKIQKYSNYDLKKRAFLSDEIKRTNVAEA